MVSIFFATISSKFLWKRKKKQDVWSEIEVFWECKLAVLINLSWNRCAHLQEAVPRVDPSSLAFPPPAGLWSSSILDNTALPCLRAVRHVLTKSCLGLRNPVVSLHGARDLYQMLLNKNKKNPSMFELNFQRSLFPCIFLAIWFCVSYCMLLFFSVSLPTLCFWGLFFFPR